MLDLDYDYLAKQVVKTQRGDSDAFAELYTATYQKQYRFTYKYVKDEYLAQDILQEVYILVLKNINTLKNPRLFVSWLNQINFRVCFDAYKKYAKEMNELTLDSDYSEKTEGTEGQHSSTEDQIVRKVTQEEMMAQILTLPPKEAQCLILRYYEDMPIEEIAEAMDCSKSTVKRLLNRGRDSVKRAMNTGKGGRKNG